MSGSPSADTADALPLLDLRQVKRAWGDGSDGFVLDVERFVLRLGEKLAIVGRSGSGKSTFLDLLALTLSPSSSARFFLAAGDDGAEIDGLWRASELSRLARLRARHVGYVLQTGGLLPFLSARENILLPLRLLGRQDTSPANRLMDRLEVTEFARRRPADLSIGQRQRVAIARALVHSPELVLADEPTASLDKANADTVMEIFAELVRDQGCSTILVTHNDAQAKAFGFLPVDCQPQESDGHGSRSVINFSGGAA